VYQVELSKRTQKQLSALPELMRVRIQTEIDALALNPRPPGASALQGSSKGLIRTRVGDYRVIYQVEDKILLVLVVSVGHRREVYK